ncbi:MAG: hypothetical protein SGBAC_000422 [Bacillariaceae sp.]
MGDRKARLAALAAKAGRTKPKRADEDEGSALKESANDSQEKKTISFRNYAPRDVSMEDNGKSSSGDDNHDEGDESAAKKRRLEETGENRSTSLAEALAEAQYDISKGQSTEAVKDMAPKKVNWDLKRDIESDLAKLERRTQRALVELLKERLDKEADESEEEESPELD